MPVPCFLLYVSSLFDDFYPTFRQGELKGKGLEHLRHHPTEEKIAGRGGECRR